MTVVIGLGTRLDVRMRTRLKNCVFRNGQRSKFEAMKSLSGWEAAHSDEDQFRATIKVST